MTRSVMAALLAVALLTVAISSAEARPTKNQQQEIQRVIRDVTPVYASTDQLSARRHSSRHHYARRGGKCDGFQRCRCGTTAARSHGLPYAYNGYNLKMASEWARAFPHTSFHVGAVGVKPHHVLTVVGGSDCRSATVHDDAGTYQRNVCGMTFVAVNGGGYETQQQVARVRQHHHSKVASIQSDYPLYIDNSRCNDGGPCAGFSRGLVVAYDPNGNGFTEHRQHHRYARL